MNSSPRRLQLARTFLVYFCLGSVPFQAQTVTQDFTLHPGWNAIWLEVEPNEKAIDKVFPSTMPISSVWTFNGKVTSPEFIQSQSEDLWNVPGWLNYFPASKPESLLNTLFSVSGQRPYLVKLDGSANVNLSISGTPSIRPVNWIPDSYNLKGFPVDPSAPPTFKTFFQDSPAHFDSALNQLRGVYRLNAGGQWTAVGGNNVMQRGEACWVFTRGASTYAGPVEVKPELGESLDFDSFADELNLLLRNNAAVPQNISLRGMSPSVPLAYATVDTSAGTVWLPLPSPLVITVAPGSETILRLGIQRGQFAGSSYDSALEINNGNGFRQYVGVHAARPENVGGRPGDVTAQADNPMAGLWVGTATLDQVNEVNSTNPTNTTPTKSTFHLRLLVHVDAGGQARLLKEVVELKAAGTFTNDANGIPVQDQPPRVVLVTDDQYLSQFQPLAVRDGQLVGRRFSSATFDFPDTDTNTLALSGTFGGSGTLTGMITLSPNFPTNPFRHKYHPDHDNLDATYENPRTEAYLINRLIELEFDPTGPPGALDYGYSTVDGTYRETITGLHKNNLVVQGDFTLSRIATTAALNQ